MNHVHDPPILKITMLVFLMLMSRLFNWQHLYLRIQSLRIFFVSTAEFASTAISSAKAKRLILLRWLTESALIPSFLRDSSKSVIRRLNRLGLRSNAIQTMAKGIYRKKTKYPYIIDFPGCWKPL